MKKSTYHVVESATPGAFMVASRPRSVCVAYVSSGKNEDWHDVATKKQARELARAICKLYEDAHGGPNEP